ncbi:uncharacterized protein SPPG_01987 [Spizellomyces punctatus DAOM BR117]|uniref:HMG box domain-containing protein n=1 Tax=Spizellomyces punctatus (strain DAOM BR117) TaxID=645134 RepID=A0A0L0HP85_SPIPD|nr:uncharacterized protein SPPG_01987 [Spizellomyces punctatus DAOM BR117]KND02907.1 hypothetical protein SPPG_01987 [Spizellomyces punctatus DAOM BR117]|eukprot:XP_016610946.1 hypothetical protein SPPG_01987 [Spizellomyces punctatus DAOM BR117]
MPFVTIPNTYSYLRSSEPALQPTPAVVYQQTPPMTGYSINDPMMMAQVQRHMAGGAPASIAPMQTLPTMQMYQQPGPLVPQPGAPQVLPARHVYSTAGQQLVLVPEGYTPVMVPSAPHPVTSFPTTQYGFPSYLVSTNPKPAAPKRIPRPANSFMTYRMEKQHEVLAKHAGANNKDISVIIGEMWRNEPEAVKEYYRKKAEMGRKEHMLRYPDYKYTPLKKRKESSTKKARLSISSISSTSESGDKGVHPPLHETGKVSLPSVVVPIKSPSFEHSALDRRTAGSPHPSTAGDASPNVSESLNQVSPPNRVAGAAEGEPMANPIAFHLPLDDSSFNNGYLASMTAVSHSYPTDNLETIADFPQSDPFELCEKSQSN